MDHTLEPITAIRRMRLCLLLPLLLVMSQHGAWLHELSHATYAATAHQVTVQQSEGEFDGGLCPSCQSFGQLGSALAGPVALSLARISHVGHQTDPQYAQVAALRHAPRNRGPPILS